MERLHQVPGVSSAAVAAGMSPLSGHIRGVKIAIEGPAPGPEKDRGIRINQVTDRYFETIGIRLLAGRSFTPRDRSGSLRVAILNETAARAFFGTESPLGRKVSFPGQRVDDLFEIVGIVADARYQDLRTPDQPMAYLPLEQAIDPITERRSFCARRRRCDAAGPVDPRQRRRDRPGRVRLGHRDDRAASGNVARAGTDARLPRHVLRRLALLLACIGLYGVMAYRVVRRTREIGIRIAIGARQQSVVWMMVRETLLLVTIGAALGTLASLGVNRFVAAQLFGVTPRDPVAIVVALSVLGCVTLIAGYLPARHASRIDPVKALRAE